MFRRVRPPQPPAASLLQNNSVNSQPMWQKSTGPSTDATHYGQWPFLLLQHGGKMTDWVPVLVMGLVVVCVTAFLLLEQKFRTPKRERQKSDRTRRPF
jgi:hypothetical protein